MDWLRIEASIRQRFRKEPHLKAKLPEAMNRLKSLFGHVGDQSKNRRALRNIGMSLVANEEEELTIVSPICLAFNPGGVNKVMVPALVEKHIAFLRSFGDSLPPWKLICLFTPSEKPGEEVDAFIQKTFEMTREKYWPIIDSEPDVEAMMIASYAPGIIALEDVVIQEICESPYLCRLASRLTTQRSKYYLELGIPSELWQRRTRRTMAQYILLGRDAAANGFVMCNHSTANIQCYLYAGAGVLHNPVGFR